MPVRASRVRRWVLTAAAVLAVSSCSGPATVPREVSAPGQQQPEADRLAIAASGEAVRAAVAYSNTHPGSPLPPQLATPSFRSAQDAALVAARSRGARFGGSDAVVSLEPVSISIGRRPGSVMRACLTKGSYVVTAGAETRLDATGSPLVRGEDYQYVYRLERSGTGYRVAEIRIGVRCDRQ